MPTPDIALGSYEAACLLGVHWTRPRKMAEKGDVEVRHLGVSRGDRAMAVYSLASVEKDLREYEDRVEAHGGKHYRRPRAWLHLRPAQLKRLDKIKSRVEFDDACSVRDAMAIMRLVSSSQLTRLLTTGEIVGRKAYNPRQPNGGALWIISRKSCEERQRRMMAAEAADTKPGPRKWIVKAKKAKKKSVAKKA